MNVEMKKFGLILNSRPDGNEAALRLFQIVNGSPDNNINLDFSGVLVLTPSFADEFLTRVKERYGTDKNLMILNADAPVVKSALEFVTEDEEHSVKATEDGPEQ